jgi:hypothetical protein
VTGDAEAKAVRRRSVEALAQALYEGSDPGGIPWVRRPPVVRDAWLLLAEQQIPRINDPSTSPTPAGGAATAR